MTFATWLETTGAGRKPHARGFTKRSATPIVGLVALAGAAGLAVHTEHSGPGSDRHAAQVSAPPGIAATIVSEEELAHVPGKKVIVEVVEFAPGASVPEHHHGGTVTVYVLSGVIRSQLDHGPIVDYSAGQTFFEAPNVVHTMIANPRPTDVAKFMAIHVIDAGAPLTTYR
jgi:quercetin dioxygenase-like cupin family protein